MLIKQNVKRKEFLCFLFFFKLYFLVFFIVITFLLTLYIFLQFAVSRDDNVLFCVNNLPVIECWTSQNSNNKENTTGDTKISFPEAKESQKKQTNNKNIIDYFTSK